MNRDSKNGRKIYYRNKASALKELNRINGGEKLNNCAENRPENNRPDFRSNLSMDLNCEDYDLANKINVHLSG